MKSIRAKLQTRKASGGLLGAEVEQLAKLATAKDVPQPDAERMQMVVDAVNNSSEVSGAQAIRTVLHKRLNMKNPHKVWLATYLAQELLEKCSDVIAPVRSDIYQDLATIAAKPLDRFQANFKDEQRAKMNAFAILRGSGKQAQSILRVACKLGSKVSLTPVPQNKTRTRLRPDGTLAPESRSNSETEHKPHEEMATSAGEPAATKGNGSSERSTSSSSRKDSNSARSKQKSSSGKSKKEKMSWPEVKEAVTTSLGIAASHTSMVQEMVLNISSGKSSAPDFEQQFLGELVEEVETFRTAFEQLLGLLAGYKNQEEAAPLVKQSVEAVEEMNNVVLLYKEVVGGLGGASGSGSSSGGAASGKSRGQGSSSSKHAAEAGASSGRSSRHNRSSSRDGKEHDGAADQLASSATLRSGTSKIAKAAPSSRAQSASGPLDSIADLGLAVPEARRSTSGRLAGDGSRRSSRSSQLQRSPSDKVPSAADPFMPAAAVGQQQMGPAGAVAAPQHIFSQQQAPMFFQPQMSQGHQTQMSQGFLPMPYGQQQPVFFMPVTGPNGEQGFAPVAFPPGGAFPQQMMPAAPTAAGPANGATMADAPQTQQQLPPSNNPFAPNAAEAVPQPAASKSEAPSDANIGRRISDSDTDSAMPRIISSDSLATPFRRPSSQGSLAASGPMLRIDSGSAIFPADTAAGVLDEAGMKSFHSSSQPSQPNVFANGATSTTMQMPAVVQAPHPAGTAPTKFDKVFDDIMSS